jgi:hypothetical protein
MFSIPTRTIVLTISCLGGTLATASAQTPDPRGPIAPWVGKTRVAPGSVQAPNYSYTPPSNATPWNPQWIWVASPTSATVAHFRRSVILPPGAQVSSALAKVSADRSYRLWVNGRLVSRGPADPGHDELYFDHWSHQWLYNTVDIASYLHPGENVISAEVFTLNFIFAHSLNHPGFAFDADIKLASGQSTAFSTTSGWRAQASTAYTEGPLTALPSQPPNKTPFGGLLYDARLDDPAWRTAGFNDSSWSAAASVTSVWGPLRASQIPESMEAIYPVDSIATTTPSLTSAAPLSHPGHDLHLSGNGSFWVNFDRILSAYPSFRVTAPAGTIIDLEPLETHDGSPFRPVQITLPAGETTFEYPIFDSFSTIRVTVSNATAPVTFADISADFVSQPVAYTGSFTSSDPWLNRLWVTARWQTQICMQDHYLDSPNHQEPIGDFGDYLIEAVENDYSFNQPWLARQDIVKFAAILDNYNSVNFHTSYSLLWLQTLMEYYDHTGDVSLLQQLKPTVDRLLDHYATFAGSDGLLSEAPNYMFMDWITIGGFATHHPPAVIGTGYLTAFYYKGLEDGARLAHVTGDSAREAHYQQLRTGIHTAFNRELWDEQSGLYKDGNLNRNHQKDPNWLPEDPKDPNFVTHSPHVNALAVLYDLAPKPRQSAIMETILAPAPINVQPYFMHFVFAAEDHAGVFDRYAWAEMQQWHLNLETRTFNEDWYGGDWSHGWGGTPLIQMSARILGVTPAAPGYARVGLYPHLAGLHSAKGTVPTQRGEVTVSWTKTPDAFTLDVTLPPNTPGDLTLPATDLTNPTLMVDGLQTPASQLLTLPAGTHHIVLKTK